MRLACWAALLLVLAPRVAHADEWWGRDKALHFGGSAVIAGGAYGIAALVSERTAPRVWSGVLAGAVAGGGKELYDLGGGGDPSGKDLVWDAAGIAVGVLFSWAIDRWLFPDDQPGESRAALSFALPLP